MPDDLIIVCLLELEPRGTGEDEANESMRTQTFAVHS